MLRRMPTALYELIETRLGRPLLDWVNERRPIPVVMSWRELAAALERETGTAIAHETLRTWFSDDEDDVDGESI